MQITIEQYDDRYQKVRVILDPESKEIFTQALAGSDNSMSMKLWHNQHITLMCVSPEIVAETLASWLGSQTEKIEKIIGMYIGTDWNGSNWVGQWDDWVDVQWLCEQLEDDMHKSVYPNGCIYYFQSADDFLDGDVHKFEYATNPDREGILDDLLSEGRLNDVYVRREDLDDELNRLAAEHRGEGGTAWTTP